MLDLFIKALTIHVAATDAADRYAVLHPIETDRPPGRVAELVHQVGSTRDRWHVESTGQAPPADGADGPGFVVRLTHRTGGLGFVDDVTVRIAARGTGSRVTAESRSRVGIGDLGQNRRNLAELLTALRERLDHPDA